MPRSNPACMSETGKDRRGGASGRSPAAPPRPLQRAPTPPLPSLPHAPQGLLCRTCLGDQRSGPRGARNGTAFRDSGDRRRGPAKTGARATGARSREMQVKGTHGSAKAFQSTGVCSALLTVALAQAANCFSSEGSHAQGLRFPARSSGPGPLAVSLTRDQCRPRADALACNLESRVTRCSRVLKPPHMPAGTQVKPHT